jgi:hypothetical protein
MNHEKIELENLSKNFEYVKACMEIDAINDIESLREISKSYIKLYLKQQEVLVQMGTSGML